MLFQLVWAWLACVWLGWVGSDWLCWIGLRKMNTSSSGMGVYGVWVWESGEEMSFDRWCPGMPAAASGGEFAGIFEAPREVCGCVDRRSPYGMGHVIALLLVRA